MRNYIAIILAAAWVNVIYADEITSAQELIFAVNSEDKFVDVVQYLANGSPEMSLPEACDSSQILTLEVAVNQNTIHIRSAKKQSIQRNYLVAVTQNEKNDLIYITSTLARSSLPGIASSKSSLKKAGERIDHLHPLRFLMTVFTDEELKANIAAIRTRGWVWDKFYDGLEGSLKEESKKDNIRNEFIIDFASIIGINASLIQPAIAERRWKDFVNALIDNVPRSGNPGRYDM